MKVKSKILLVAVSALFLMFPVKEETGEIVFDIVPQVHMYNAKIVKTPSGKDVYSINDLTYQKRSIPYITDITLSFNYPPENFHRDDTKKYRIKSASYVFTKGKGSIGKGSAHFFKSGDGVEIENSKNLWLGSCDDLGSFIIETRFRADTLSDGAVLFSRMGYITGAKRGIEIMLSRGRVLASFYGVFERPDGKKHDVFLNRGRQITAGRWYHLSVSFDRMTGQLVKYIDGEEEETVYVTDSGSPENGIFTPYFGTKNADGSLVCTDLPPVFIGKNFTGLLDEFRISYLTFDELKRMSELAIRKHSSVDGAGRIPLNVEGVIASPVYKFNGPGTRINLFRWEEITPQNTFCWMEFRISDSLFYWTDTNLKWYRIKNGQRNIFLKDIGNGEFLRGKYYQWRLHLVPSPDGRVSPLVYDVALSYRPDLAPKVPNLVEVSGSGDEYINLRWVKNVDADIMGYRIYYGTVPGRFDGVISHVGGKRISNDISKGNYIEIKITNGLIEENKNLDKKGILSFPLIKNTILYFFAVSAYDSYKVDTQFNHESGLSKQVSARPYAGSEIDK